MIWKFISIIVSFLFAIGREHDNEGVLLPDGNDVEINFLSKRFYVRKLDRNDVEMIYDMSCENHIFYQYHPPFVTKESILEDMEALPPGKNSDDKFYVVFLKKKIWLQLWI